MNIPVTSVASIGLYAACGVLAVSTIPGFAQSNTGVERYPTISLATVSRPYEAGRSAGYDHVQLAPNFSVASVYRDQVEQMLRRSRTFRRQSARIGAARHLAVELLGAGRQTGRAAAWTTIAHEPDGRLHASMTVAHVGRTAELIAHELEHVIEQLDGVDLRHLSRVAESGVRRCDCASTEAFETTRAIRIGLRVAEEMGERYP
jgi:hypothetical protein